MVKRMLWTSRHVLLLSAAGTHMMVCWFGFSLRPKLFLQRALTRRLMQACAADPQTEHFAHLWLMAYAFLLRLPSEGLPAMRGDAKTQVEGHSVFYLKAPLTVCLRLRSRKNRCVNCLI